MCVSQKLFLPMNPGGEEGGAGGRGGDTAG